MLQNTGCTYFFRTFFSFNKALFKKVLSYFMDEKNEAQGQHLSKVLDPSWDSAWLSHWWMDSVHQNCLECVI